MEQNPNTEKDNLVFIRWENKI